MRTALTENSEIILQEIGTQKTFRFKILETIGMGASCIVYTAVYEDTEKNQFFVRLKECYPAELEISRNQKQELVISDTEIFRKELQHFTDGYQNQLKFRTIPESMNSISNIQGIYQGNDTKYIAMSCQNGISLKQADLNIYDIFRVLKSVTKQIQNFHENGWLYLDLKPENILLYPETPELVMLFDFDSALKLDEIQSGRLSFTKSWSAPEVMQKKLSKIGICSDIYSIGALLMYLLLGRTPEVSDRRSFTSWDSEFENSLLAKESPETKKLVSDIFRNTLSSDVNSRYASCQNLLDVIEPFIQSFQKQKPYLKTVLPMGTNYFCGREREISEIHEILQNQTNFLILHGIGGIGKSELAKNYAKAFSEAYDAVVFVRYHDSISETIADDLQFHVEHLQRSEEESDEEYFNRKIKVLKSICTPRHLIILDNFDTDECEYLDELTSLPCKFLITSRTDFSEVFPQYEIDILDDFTSIFSIFQHYYHHDTEAFTEEIENIIYALEWHTMAVELVSKQMNLTSITPAEMYDKLCEQGISASKEKIKHLKDGTLRNRNALNHIEILFSVFNLSENLKQILKHIALIGSTPIERTYFLELCDFSQNEVQYLDIAVQGGWVQAYDNNLYLHSLIAEALCSQLKPDSLQCQKLVESMIYIAERINTFQADQRKLQIRWIDHAVCNLAGWDELFAELMITVNFHIYMQEMLYNKAIYSNQKIISTLERLQPVNTEQIAYAYLFLAVISERTGNSKEAEKYYSKVKELGYQNQMLEVHVIDALDNGDVAQARYHIECMLKFAENSHDFYIAYGYFVMLERMNENQEKVEEYSSLEVLYLERFLEENQTEQNPQKIAEMYSDAGDVYRDVENYEKSALCYQKAILETESVLGEKCAETMMLYQSLGVSLFLNHNINQGIKSYETACEISERIFGIEHEDTIEMLRELCTFYFMSWENTFNIEYLKKAKMCVEKILPYLSADEAELELENCLDYFYHAADICKENQYEKQLQEIELLISDF